MKKILARVILSAVFFMVTFLIGSDIAIKTNTPVYIGVVSALLIILTILLIGFIFVWAIDNC